MAIELVREPLRIKRVVGEESLQFSVQGDLIIPDAKADLLGVLSIDSNVMVNEREVLTDKVVLGGVVNFNIIYLAKDEDRPIRALNASVPFKEPLEIDGAKQGMTADVDGIILNSEYEILNERKIVVEAIAQLGVVINERVEAEVIVDTLDEDNIQKQKEEFEICQFIGECSDRFTIKEEVDIPEAMPSVFEVLSAEASISREIKVSDNKVIVKGEVNVRALYSGEDEDRSIETVEYTFPFTQFMDIPGVDENAFCDVDAVVGDLSAIAEEDTEGELRILRFKAAVELNARAFVKEQKQMIVDMYSPDYMIDMERKELYANQIAAEAENELVLKDKVQLPEKSEVKKINGMTCKPIVIDVKVQHGKVTINGAVEVRFLYSSGEMKTPSSYKYEIPFMNSMDIKEAEPEMMYKVNVETVSCGYNLEPDGNVDVRIVLKTQIKLYKNSKLNIINKAEGIEPDEGVFGLKPSIIVYFVQPGDTLWKIGKKFNVSLQELIRINNIANPDQLAIGQLIIIPKKPAKKVYVRQ
ncbi:MAG: DUF3794 and LysM peptidoglycan-binding domain-containing protein [Deltaproteobacteria bacterium]